MSSLSNVTVDEIIELLNFNITSLSQLKESIGFTTTDGKFHLRLGFKHLLERLLFLVKAKKNARAKNLELSNKQMENDLCKKITDLWTNNFKASNNTSVPILIPWTNNIIENLHKTKNKFSYDYHIQQLALLVFIFSGRNCYEFLRLNLPAALPHISSLESLIRKQEMKIIECEFRFEPLNEYIRSIGCRYVYVGEDSTSSLSHIDYDAQTNSFIGFSSPLFNGIPQMNYFRTNNFDELKNWFNEFDKSKFITLHMIQSIAPSTPPMIL